MPEGAVGLIAGEGALPAALDAALRRAGRDVAVFALRGHEPAGLSAPDMQVFDIERLVPLFHALHGRGVEEVALAGAVRRRRLDPERLDPDTAQLLPTLLPALQAGDDATLRAVIALFEEAGFAVRGAGDLAPGLLAAPGRLAGPEPGAADQADIARAAVIVAALSAADVAQAAVVAQGLCLGVEALAGTDAMLADLAPRADALRPDPDGARGVLYKAPKPGQERRADLPAIGPGTVRAAAVCGLAGIAIEAGGVLVLEREETCRASEAAGLFLVAHAP